MKSNQKQSKAMTFDDDGVKKQWNSMKTNTVILKSMKIYENHSKHTNIGEKQWNAMAIYVKHRNLMPHNEKHWKSMITACKSMRINDN